MLLITHTGIALFGQKGRGWLIKYWQIFAYIIASFSKDYYGQGWPMWSGIGM